MNRIVLTLVLLTTLLATASAATRPLLSDPTAPSAGYYLRLEDRAIVEYVPAQYAVFPRGFAGSGTLLSEDGCAAVNAWCEPSLAGTCSWQGDPFNANPQTTDSRQALCTTVRAKADGADAWFQARAAVRVATLSNPASAQRILSTWQPIVKISWFGPGGYLGDQGANNPSVANVAFSGCTVSLAGQDATTAHWLGDCVWMPTAAEDIEDHIPAGLVGTPTGFDAHVIMTIGGSSESMPTATIMCRDCFTTGP